MISKGRQRPECQYWALATSTMGTVLDLYPDEVARYARRKTIDGFEIVGRFTTRDAAEACVLAYMRRRWSQTGAGR